MKANKIGDAVTIETKRGEMIPGVVEKINVKSVTFESGGNKYNVPGTLQTASAKVSTSDYRITVWLDPEEAAKEEVQRNARRQAREDQKREDEAKKMAEEDARIAAIVAFATELGNRPLPEKGEGARFDEARDEWCAACTIGDGWLDATNELIERQRCCRYDAASYFEWSENDMKLAAKQKYYGEMIYLMRRETEPFTAVAALAAVKGDLKKRILRNEFRNNSSNAARNAMTDAIRDFACTLVGEG